MIAFFFPPRAVFIILTTRTILGMSYEAKLLWWSSLCADFPIALFGLSPSNIQKNMGIFEWKLALKNTPCLNCATILLCTFKNEEIFYVKTTLKSGALITWKFSWKRLVFSQGIQAIIAQKLRQREQSMWRNFAISPLYASPPGSLHLLHNFLRFQNEY